MIKDIGELLAAEAEAAEAHRGEVRDAREATFYDRVRGARFIAAMQDRGIRLIGRGLWYLSGAHTEADVDQAIAAARASFEELS